MATRTVTYSCGHEGELRLSGPHKERDRKVAWAQERGLCSDCYKASLRAEGPTAYVRRVPGYDPAADREDGERRLAEALAAITKLEPEAARPQTAANIGSLGLARADLANARRDEASARDQIKMAGQSAAREPAVEVYVANSYEAREQLKARGYRFSQDRYSYPGDLLGAKPCPAWGWQSPDTAAVVAELTWIQEQGWTLEGVGTCATILQAITEGRPDLAGLAS